MTKQILASLMTIVLFTSTACAEDPQAAVPSKVVDDNSGNQGSNTEEPETLKAIIYTGKVFNPNANGGDGVLTNKPCTIQLSMIEEDGTHIFIAQLLEKLHNVKVSAMELSRHYLKASDGKYFKTQPDGEAFEPSLVHVEAEGVEEPDVNKIDEYSESETTPLIKSIELPFMQGLEFEELEEEMENVLESNNTELSVDNIAVLDKLNDAIIKTHHNGHTDTLLCRPSSGSDRLVLSTQSQMVNFDIDHDDDHDHDHDH